MDGIFAASSVSPSQDVQLAVQYSILKDVAELQKNMVSEIMQSIGIGQNIDLLV